MDLSILAYNGPEMPPMEQITELVRGQDQMLLERYLPLARRESVSLDFISVRRVDAAGVSALLSLYTTAHKAGHRVTILNASPRVQQTLALLGLDCILLSQNAV
ncbi:MAG: STAS domain-containing protein [Terracidiphilus sp.]|jgi:anti-anti-sigma regulatory factor